MYVSNVENVVPRTFREGFYVILISCQNAVGGQLGNTDNKHKLAND